MSQRLVARLTALALVGSLMLFALACGGSDTVPDQQVNDSQAQQTREVNLYQYRFNPSSIEVTQGTTVIFKNRDTEAHNINIPALGVDQSIQPNQEWSYTFSSRGEYAVGNRFSNDMRLDVTVR